LTIHWIVTPLLAAIAALALAAASTLATPAEQQDGSYSYPIQVTSVTVQSSGGSPQQVTLDVEGVVGDGCTRVDKVVQWRERETNLLVVRILGRHSGAQICTMIAQLYHDTTLLDGPLPPGDYTVDVNGVTRALHIDGGGAVSGMDSTGSASDAAEG